MGQDSRSADRFRVLAEDDGLSSSVQGVDVREVDVSYPSPALASPLPPSPSLPLPLPCPSPALFLHPPSRAPLELGYIVAGRLWWSDLTSMLGIDIRQARATVSSKWWSIFRKFSAS